MRILFTALILIATMFTSYGQAWTKEKGKFYAKIGLNAINSKVVYDYNGNVVDEVLHPTSGDTVEVPHVFESMIQVYGMYGLTDKITLVGSIPLKSIQQKGMIKSSRTSLADLEFGGVYGSKTTGLRITPGFFVGIPTGYYNANELTITGDGEFNFMPRIYIGKGSSKFYYTGFVGFNYRTKGRFHEIDALLEGGYTLGKLILIGKLQYKESLNGGEDIFSITGIYDNGQEYLSPNLSLYYKYTEKLHFSLNVGGAVYSRNAQAAASVNFGIAYEN